MKPFRDRNPVVIGVLGFAVIGALMLGAFRADRLPLIGGGETYYAEFAEAGGLDTGSEVRLAGVSVGDVTDIELDGDVVRVEMLIDTDADLGEDTGAKIQVRTILGAMYVALEPAGSGELTSDDIIPVSRTESPYDIVQALSDLSTTTDELDQEQLAAALDEVSELSTTIPDEFGDALEGLSRASATLSARDREITDLLVGIERATSVLNDNDEELEILFADADVLFREVANRRDSIRTLLISTQTVSNELTALIEENEEQITPMLEELEEITGMLVRIESSLDEALRLGGPFARFFANTLGVGPWFELDLDLTLPQIEEILDNSDDVFGQGGNR